MAKKSFKDNPALQFISNAEDEKAAPTTPTAPQQTGKPPEGYKLNPLYVEKRSRRVQLTLQPSLYERVKARAGAAGISVNDYVHTILEAATKEE